MAAKLGNLCGDVGAAVDRHSTQTLLVLGECLELLSDLLSELAGGRKNKGLNVIPLGVEVIEQWQPKCCGLACTCLGQPNEISVAFQQQGNCLHLDVGGRLEAHLSDGFQKRVREPKGVKCVQKEGESGHKGRPFMSDESHGVIHKTERSNFKNVGAVVGTRKVAWSLKRTSHKKEP